MSSNALKNSLGRYHQEKAIKQSVKSNQMKQMEQLDCWNPLPRDEFSGRAAIVNDRVAAENAFYNAIDYTSPLLGRDSQLNDMTTLYQNRAIYGAATIMQQNLKNHKTCL